MWFNNLHLWAEGHGGTHTVELFDGVPDLGPADIVDLYQDAHGQWRAIYELVLPWDTTVCYNDTYYVMGTVNCENLTSIGAVEVEHSVPPHPVFDIRNCLIKSVETNAGKPDYLFYDPHHEDYAEPTVDFTIEDEGERVRGPYRWTVFFRPTGYMSWDQGGYGWVQGTAWGSSRIRGKLYANAHGVIGRAGW
ncbi:MAG: hypothetical protein M5U09_24980 [Gammaproteobacteria bacterium]|nr:hypothetical protein [Gammaproteobacteria bacterium]